jgi:acyl-CoA thioesterase FadM
MYSRLTDANAKSFVVSSVLKSGSGDELAHIELCLLAVDLATRRACTLPDFVRQAMSTAA